MRVKELIKPLSTLTISDICDLHHSSNLTNIEVEFAQL